MALLRSSLDTRYVSWPITAPSGVSIGSDTAKVAFVSDRWDDPDSWSDASIVVDAVRYGDSTPRFRILLGPNGGLAPGKGTWFILGKIIDTPEAPVFLLDTITLK